MLAVKRVIDLLMNAASVVAEYLAQCHGCNSAATDCDCRDEIAGGSGRRVARDRRNARSLARLPKIANASAHRVRASTCGQSSSHP